jgi:hypothetical protein
MRSVNPGPLSALRGPLGRVAYRGVGVTKSHCLPRPRRWRRCERPLAPSPTAVSWLREATARSARSVIVVAIGHCLPRPPRCHHCERPLAPSPTTVSPFRESPGAGPPRSPGAKVPRRSSSSTRYPLRGWLARFSLTPSSRNHSCSRPSNQQFQPGAWPCSSGVEVGQAQAELRVGGILENPLGPVLRSVLFENRIVHLPSAPSRFRTLSAPQPVCIVPVSSVPSFHSLSLRPLSNAFSVHSFARCHHVERTRRQFLLTSSTCRTPSASNPWLVVVGSSAPGANSWSLRRRVERLQRPFLCSLSSCRAHHAPIPVHAILVPNALRVQSLARCRMVERTRRQFLVTPSSCRTPSASIPSLAVVVARAHSRVHTGNGGTSPPTNRFSRQAGKSRRAPPAAAGPSG